MTSKRKKASPSKKIRVALPPPGMRPKLGTAKVWAIAINMQTNLAALTQGTEDQSILWDFVGGVLTWKRVAEAGRHAEASRIMSTVYNVVLPAVIGDWIRTGVAKFSQEDALIAAESHPWAEALAEHVDLVTAKAAASWSEGQLSGLVRQYRQERLEYIDRALAKVQLITEQRRSQERACSEELAA